MELLPHARSKKAMKRIALYGGLFITAFVSLGAVALAAGATGYPAGALGWNGSWSGNTFNCDINNYDLVAFHYAVPSDQNSNANWYSCAVRGFVRNPAYQDAPIGALRQVGGWTSNSYVCDGGGSLRLYHYTANVNRNESSRNETSWAGCSKI